MRYKSEKINQIMQTEAGDFSIKFFRYRSTTSQRASARWLVVERYLKNLIEKSPVSVCLESSNYSFPDLYLISLCRVTILHVPYIHNQQDLHSLCADECGRTVMMKI